MSVKRATGKAWGNALGGYKTQRRDSRGRFSTGTLVGNSLHKKAKRRGGGFVPYARKGLGHTTVGVNSGLRVSRNRRISAGFYFRTDTDSGSKKAAKVAKAQEYAQLAVASRMPTGGDVTLGGNLKRVKKAQAKALRKTIGKERKAGAYSFARTGTDRNSLPTVIVRFNSPKNKKNKSDSYRNRSIVRYNAYSATGKRTYDWTQKTKKSRPQRRKAKR